MAIKSSGQLSLRYDILPELGGSYVNLSLRDLSSRAGFSTPDAMSEFYGYSASLPNNGYYQTRRGFITNGAGTGNAPGNASILSLGATFMGWFRVDSTTKKNQIMLSCGGQNNNGNGSLRFHYIASLNRLIVEAYDGGGTRRLRRQYPLHDNPNRSITGITSSATGWERDQRGNVDSQGWVHLAFSIALNGSSYTGIKTYWNGAELTYSVNNVSSAVRMDNQVDPNYMTIGNWHWVGDNGSIFEGAIDSFAFFNYVMSPINIQTIYNGGNYFVTNALPAASPLPIYANGVESNLTTQVINTWNYPMATFGYSWFWNTHPAGYP